MVEMQIVEQPRGNQPVESRAAKAIREGFESGRPLTYVLTAEEQRVARVLGEVGRTMGGSTPIPVWTWTLTEGLRRDGSAAEPGTTDGRRALDFVIAHAGAGHLPLQGFSRRAARLGRKCGGGCAMSTRAAWTKANSW